MDEYYRKHKCIYLGAAVEDIDNPLCLYECRLKSKLTNSEVCSSCNDSVEVSVAPEESTN